MFRDYTVEFKNMVKELHRNGIEVVMEMFFTDESTGFILQCVRYWVTEYHIDGVHVYCDESALKALSQDALLADTKIITVYWNGKTDTMVHAAANLHSLLLEHAHTRSGLTSVEDEPSPRRS